MIGSGPSGGGRDGPYRRRPAGEPADDPRTIGETLDGVLARMGVPGAAVVHTVFTEWDALVGDELAPHVRPVSLDWGCLLVAVDAPGWATRLRYDQVALLARCAEALGPGVVTGLQVRVRGS